MTPTLSIIIPTRHRADILRQCLEHLAKQTIAEELEVIVVHDGEDDEETAAMIENVKCQMSNVKCYFAIPKSQQGVARNRGVERATADRVLFLGDDIFLEPEACESHLRIGAGLGTRDPDKGSHALLDHQSTHRIRIPESESPIPPVAILGFVSWDPAVGITPAMRWLDKTGWQFGYRFLEKYAHDFLPHAIQHRFTYTNQLSLPTAVARAHPFREDLSLYGWEDILWGEELRESGIGLYYEPDAKGVHYHRITLEDSLKRMETLGRSVVQLEKISPGFDRRPKGLKLFLYKLAALLPTMGGKHRKAFLRGILTEEHEGVR